jgi:hypothetical protein
MTNIEAGSYAVLVDETTSERILGLKVNPRFGESFVIPMTARTAVEIGNLLLARAH